MEGLGVDLGNVIIDHVGFGTTPEFVSCGDYDSIPPVPGVLEALGSLQKRFNGNIFVVYNATDTADLKIISWLKSHAFFEITGITPDRVRRTNKGRNKSLICEEYGATHFIDDRLEVLSHLIGKLQCLYLFRPQQHEVDKYRQFLPYVQEVKSWNEVVQILLNK